MEVPKGVEIDADGGGVGAQGAGGVEEEGAVVEALGLGACALWVPGNVIEGSSRF